MPWGLIIGGALSYMGSQDAADSYSNSADKAAANSKFTPYNVYSGYGSGTFTPATAGTAGRAGYWSGGTPGGYDRGGAMASTGGKWIPGTAGTPGTAASATASLNPQYQGLRDQYMQQAKGFNGALTSYDPNQAAQNLYQQLSQIGSFDRQQNQNAFENRLVNQGQMGLQQDGQNPLLRAYQNAQGQEDLQRQLAAFGMSQDVQDRLQARGMNATQAASGLDSLALQNLNLGGAFGGKALQGSQFGAGLQMNAAGVQAGTNAAFWQNLGQQVGPAIGGAFGYRPQNSQYTNTDYGGGFYPSSSYDGRSYTGGH